MLLVILISAVLLGLAAWWAVNGIWSGRSAARRYALAPVFVVLSIMVLRYPLYYCGYAGEYVAEGWIAGGLHGIVSGLQTIGLNESLSELMDRSAKLLDGSTVTCWAYNVYTSLQYALALPICGASVIGAILRFGVWAQLAVTTRPVYFFSALTEEAVIFAESIDKSMHAGGGKDPLICFCVPADEHKATLCWQRARDFGAVALRQKLTAHSFPKRAGHVTCVLCSADENENVKDLARLLREEEVSGNIRNGKTVRHFVFAGSSWAEQAVDALGASCGEDPHRMVFMLNPRESLAAHILSEHPLHAYCGQKEDGTPRLNVLVVGSTPLADWFLRTAYACGQLCGCELSITLADQDAQACRERLLLDAPMLDREAHPLVRDCGALRFVQLQHRGEAADAALLKEMDYVFLALEEDEENIMLAGRIASVINRQKLTDERRAGQRVAVVYTVQDAGLGRICDALTAKEQTGTALPCERIPVGDRESRCQVSVLLEDTLLHRAFFVNEAYCRRLNKVTTEKPEALLEKYFSFMKNAYNRRSSMACALQMGYYAGLLRGGNGAADALADAEHRRWSAYTMMDGYQEPTHEELKAYLYRGGNSHRSKELKLHPCLVTGRTNDFERLRDDLDCMLLERIGHPEAGDDVQKMQKAMHTDYRAKDAEILSSAEEIMRMAEDSEITQVLRHFWQ